MPEQLGHDSASFERVHNLPVDRPSTVQAHILSIVRFSRNIQGFQSYDFQRPADLTEAKHRLSCERSRRLRQKKKSTPWKLTNHVRHADH